MTGQDGGFRAAAARFSAEVDAALTRARRAASEARATSAEFRQGNRELTEQAKTGRLRGVPRDQVTPTAPGAREAATKFRNANGLPVEVLPDAGALLARGPVAEPAPAPEPEDEDFSQHAVMVDVDERDEPSPERHTGARGQERTGGVPDEARPARIDSPAPDRAPADSDDEDFSQQRILLDVTDETYRPNAFPDATLGLPDGQNRS